LIAALRCAWRSGNGLTPAIADQLQPVSRLLVAPGEHAHIVLGFELQEARGRTDALMPIPARRQTR
jgi:hypothetical protein